jgi:hypothetical protein
MQHRLKLAACLALFGLLFVIAPGSLAFPEKGLMGKLTKIGNGALYLDQSGKSLTLLIGPRTELWRHGNDLRSTSQLVLGQDIRAVYSEIAADGSPIATLVVQSEAGDTVKMVPHQVVEYRLCSGSLIQVTNDSITLRTGDDKTCITHVDARTEIWYGRISHDPTVLRVGDDISTRNVVQYPQENLVAEKVWTGNQPAPHRVAPE